MADSLLTVLTSATTTALTDLASVQAELGLSGQDEAPYLNAQIAAASAAIASWCGRSFGQEQVREIWRDLSLPQLALARWPITSIASVVQDGETLQAAQYEADAAAGMLWRLSDDERIRWEARKLTVTYTAGYLLPSQSNRTLPADVQRAATLMVAAQYNARGRDPMLRSESAQDVGQASYLDPRAGMEAMPPQAAALLQPYRAWRL
jgi:hypothetical protein